MVLSIESYLMFELFINSKVIVVMGYSSNNINNVGILYSNLFIKGMIVSIEDFVFIILNVLGCNVFLYFYFIG